MTTKRRPIAAALALGTAAIGTGAAVYAYQAHAAQTPEQDTQATSRTEQQHGTGVAPGQAGPASRHERGGGTQGDARGSTTQQSDDDATEQESDDRPALKQSQTDTGTLGTTSGSTRTNNQPPGHSSSSGS